MLKLAFRFAAVLLLAAVANAAAAGLAIVQPAPEATVHDNAGALSVALAIEDGATLPPGYRVRLLLDGEPAAPDDRDLQFQLNGIERGSHRLQALIVDTEGRVLTRSAPVTFYMWQASRRFPNRR